MKKTGEKKINWARRYMKLLESFFEEYRDLRIFKGVKIVTAIHLEAKTANFILYLKELGAELTVTACNPLSTQDDVAEALKARGITVYARRTHDVKEYFSNIRKALETAPHLILDDGADLTVMVHTEMTQLLSSLRGISEETTTGVRRASALAKQGKLEVPVMAVNNSRMKFLFDNRYGTGQSTWDALMRNTNILIAGKNVVVAGYGWCGRGIAMRARGFGARVIVTEVDPIRAVEAVMDGFQVMGMKDAAKLGDIFVTSTGNRNIITREHFILMKDGVILANAGHFNVEIDVETLEKMAVEKFEARPNVTTYVLKDGRKLNLLADGRLVNLAAGDGHPVEIMDISFSLQLLSLKYLLENDLPPGVHLLPAEIDEMVARKFLKIYGYTLDTLTEEQKKYLESAGSE